MLLEQNSNALLLLRSFMISILDKAEKAIPSLTPEHLKMNTINEAIAIMIRIQNIRKRFRKLHALNDINVEFRNGHVIALIGQTVR
jgi:ABC-type polysaccharide/polyol phosphate transport system ATPase subunit